MTRERILFATEGRRPAGSGLMGSGALETVVYPAEAAEQAAAALAICARAKDKADAILLLAMCGLIPGSTS